jgi:hypothetical protein
MENLLSILIKNDSEIIAAAPKPITISRLAEATA